jgi:nucleoside-diphosphate-sugar epimerase
LFRTVRHGFNVVPGPTDPRLSMIYVDDLVTGLLLAAERGRRLTTVLDGPEAEQGIYFTAMDEAATLTEMAQAAASAMNLPAPRTFFVPRPLCWLGAYANQCRGWLLRKPVLLTPDKMREATAGSWICSSHKAKIELGFTCSTLLAEGFRKTADWYLRHGWL